MAFRPPVPTGLGLTVAVGTLLADTVYNNDECIMISPESGMAAAKGQLISEQIYAVLNFPKMQRNITRISALASKMGQIKKVKVHYHPN